MIVDTYSCQVFRLLEMILLGSLVRACLKQIMFSLVGLRLKMFSARFLFFIAVPISSFHQGTHFLGRWPLEMGMHLKCFL